MAEAQKPYVANSLDDIGAAVIAIRSLTERAGSLDEESTRAVYQLACLASVVWRCLDAEEDKPSARK